MTIVHLSAPVTLDPTVQVNTLALAARLSDGNAAVIYSIGNTAADVTVKGQIVGSDGSLIGQSFTVGAGYVAGSRVAVESVQPASGGKFVIERGSVVGITTSDYYIPFLETGAQLGTPVSVPIGNSGTSFYTMTALANGTVVQTTVNQTFNPAAAFDVTSQIVTLTGTPIATVDVSGLIPGLFGSAMTSVAELVDHALDSVGHAGRKAQRPGHARGTLGDFIYRAGIRCGFQDFADLVAVLVAGDGEQAQQGGKRRHGASVHWDSPRLRKPDHNTAGLQP